MKKIGSTWNLDKRGKNSATINTTHQTEFLTLKFFLHFLHAKRFTSAARKHIVEVILNSCALQQLFNDFMHLPTCWIGFMTTQTVILIWISFYGTFVLFGWRWRGYNLIFSCQALPLAKMHIQDLNTKKKKKIYKFRMKSNY